MMRTGPFSASTRATWTLAACFALVAVPFSIGNGDPAETASAPHKSEEHRQGKDVNVVFVSVDTTRADHLGCYGHPLSQTPNIDRFAAEGTLFENCISSAPLTLPSHSTMMTGSYPFVHGARDNGIYTLGPENETLGELFRDAGFRTHGEVAAMVLDRKYGLDQGFETFGDVEQPTSGPQITEFDLRESDEPAFESERFAVRTERKADEITDRGIELIRERVAANERFFLFLHYFDPHWPHEAPERFTNEIPDGYLAEISFFDEQFGRLVDAIRDSGVEDRTLVILTSDHGEGRGQHGEHTHSVFLYDTTLHVPLIVWAPGNVPAGQVVEQQVRLVDLAPTVVEFAGLERTPQMQGESLFPLLRDPASAMRLPCYSDTMVPRNALGFSPLRSLRTDAWKFILAPRDELYDLEEDALEIFNVSRIEKERAAEMREELRQIVLTAPALVTGAESLKALDDEERRMLEALGYTSGFDDMPEAANGSEIDHFEPSGVNPRDRVEVVECWASGLGSFLAGQYELSEKLYRRFLELEPDSAMATSYLGRCLLMQQRDEEAIEVFRRALELNPESTGDLRSLGNLLASNNQYSEAIECFEKLVRLDSREVIGRINLGMLFAAKRDFEGALALYSEAERLDPEQPRVHLQRGMALRLMGRTDEALVAFDEALRLGPDLAQGNIQKAAVLRQTGKTEEALELLAAAIESTPEQPLYYYEAAKIHTAIGNPELAGTNFKRTAELLPENGVAFRHLGTNLLVRGDAEAAVVELRKATELAPDLWIAHHHLALALEQTGETEEAVKVFAALLNQRPRYGPAYLPAANLLVSRGESHDAIRLLRRARGLFENDPTVANALAWYLATVPQDELRNGEEAVQLAEWATEETGAEDPTILDTLSAAYAEVGRFEDALSASDRALQVARERGDAELIETVGKHKAAYSDKKPIRSP